MLETKTILKNPSEIMENTENVLLAFSKNLEELAETASKSLVSVRHASGAGSGLVLTPDGYILTNSHVVGNERSVQIGFWDGELTPATVVGTDAKTDLAVLQVHSSHTTSHLKLIDKREVKVGQLAMALGNPYRFERSVSLGVVSAIDRSLPTEGALLEGLIQTDAAINPGNSGGPLVSADAKVIGINTAIVPFARGLGFAVPAYTASWVAGELLQKGRIQRRYLGIGATSVELPARLNPTKERRRAVLVMKVETGSPAALSGLATGDLLLFAEQTELWNLDDLQRVLSLGNAREIDVAVLRASKIQKTIRVRPTEAKAA